MGMYKVLGLRVESYMGQTCQGHNCDFEYGEELRDRHVLLLKEVDTSEQVELTLSWEEDQCGSGWCTSTEANFDWCVVDNFAGMNYKPIKDLVINLSLNQLNDLYEDSVNNEVFYFSPSGGDHYYPSGSYDVDMELFTPSSN